MFKRSNYVFIMLRLYYAKKYIFEIVRMSWTYAWAMSMHVVHLNRPFRSRKVLSVTALTIVTARCRHLLAQSGEQSSCLLLFHFQLIDVAVDFLGGGLIRHNKIVNARWPHRGNVRWGSTFINLFLFMLQNVAVNVPSGGRYC